MIGLKPGYRTTEFWFTLVSFIFSGLFLAGVITDNQYKEELIQNVSHAVESCILIGGQLLIVYKYVNGRSQLKKEKLIDESHATRKQPVRKKSKPRSSKK